MNQFVSRMQSFSLIFQNVGWSAYNGKIQTLSHRKLHFKNIWYTQLFISKLKYRQLLGSCSAFRLGTISLETLSSAILRQQHWVNSWIQRTAKTKHYKHSHLRIQGITGVAQDTNLSSICKCQDLSLPISDQWLVAISPRKLRCYLGSPEMTPSTQTFMRM